MSLRMRLFLSYTFIVIICLGVAAGAVAVLLQSYRDQAIMTRLDDMIRPIAVQVKGLLQNRTSVTDVWTNIQEQAQKNNVFILLVGANGNIVRQTSPEGTEKVLKVEPAELPHGIKQPEHGTFVTTGGQTFVYAAYPIARADSTVATRLETLVLATPRSGGLLVLASLFRPFIWAGLIALVVSVMMAIFLARSIYRPIQALAGAAENIAKGQYDQEIPVTGTREVRGLAASLNEMSAKVKDSHYQLRHYVADVSHQLKSPLTSIQGFAQAMLDGTAADNETRQKASQIIVDESKRMLRQVNELLELSRMQAGQVKWAQEPVDVKELLQHSQEIFSQRAEEKHITLRSRIEPLMPVTGDADHLEDVFCNLLDNAIKNTPEQGEIQVSARNIVNKTVEIAIADSGPGIPPEQLPYVFKRFQQPAGLRSGSGLGLAIAREIVTAHNGKIEAFSNPGEGARFVVTLPTSIVDA